MASVWTHFEESSIDDDDDDSSSMAAYSTFNNSLSAEDSVEQIRRRRVSINGDPLQSNSEIEEHTDDGMFKPCCCKCVDISLTVIVIALVWMMMALPTGFYTHTVISQTPAGPTVENNNSTENNSYSMCLLYNGTLCKTYLQQYVKCLDSARNLSNLDVYVPGPIDLENNAKVFEMLGKVQFMISPKCLQSLQPLMCLYFFHLCDDDNEVITPSKKQCENIEKVCDNELKIIQSLPFKLPINIPEVLSSCAPNNPFDNKNCNITGNTTPQSVNCSNGFYKTDEETCKPQCNVWTPYSYTTVLISDILVTFSAAVAIISGFAVLFLSWVRYQKLYRYPSIFVIYQTIPTVVLAVLVLVGVSARTRLFCRSKDLVESILNPTPFCVVTGIALYYIMMQLLLWWLWHTTAVFWAVTWPFHARKFNTSRNNRCLHIVFVLASLILPILPVLIVIFVSSKPGQTGGFTMTRVPPVLCAGFDIHTTFWAFVFPLSVLLATGVTLLVFILRMMIKQHFLAKIHKIRINLNWVLEVKLLVVLGYYVILGAAVLTIFTYSLVSLSEFLSNLTEYLSCEGKGLTCTNERNKIEKIVRPVPTVIAFVVLGFFPTVNLIFVVKLKELGNKLMCCQTRQVQFAQKESSRSSNYIPYKVHREPASTTLHHGSLIVHH